MNVWLLHKNSEIGPKEAYVNRKKRYDYISSEIDRMKDNIKT